MNTNLGIQAGQADFLSNQPLAKKAEQLTRMSPLLLQEAQKAAMDLARLIADSADDERLTGKQRRLDAGRPQLAPPKQSAAQEPGRTTGDTQKAGLLLASMMLALEQGNLSKLAINAHSAATRDAVRKAGNEQLAKDYEEALSQVKNALDQLNALTEKLAGLTDQAKALELQLAEAETALAALEPGTPEYAAALAARDALRAKLTSVQGEQGRVQQAVQSAQEQFMALQNRVNDLLARVEKSDVNMPRGLVEKDLSNIARMLALMTQLGELMLTAGETRAEIQRSLLKVQEEVRIKKLLQDAEKAEKELAKAEALNKAMGCVGKILGAVVTAVSVIGAAFTGGASLALAGIGLALMLSDEIYQGVTGNSFLQEAFKPIMKLLQPLLQFVMDKVAGMLEGLGVDAQAAKMVSMIAVSIAIAAAVVVLAVTGAGSAIASAASNVLSKMGTVLTKVLEKTIGKLVPEMLKKSIAGMAKQLSSAASKMFDAVTQRLGLMNDNASKQIYSQRLMQMSSLTNLGKTAAEGGLSVGSASAELQAARFTAATKFTMGELDLVNDMFANLLEQFKQSFTISQGFFNSASEAVKQHGRTGVAMARAVRGSRSA